MWIDLVLLFTLWHKIQIQCMRKAITRKMADLIKVGNTVKVLVEVALGALEYKSQAHRQTLNLCHDVVSYSNEPKHKRTLLDLVWLKAAQ